MLIFHIRGTISWNVFLERLLELLFLKPDSLSKIIRIGVDCLRIRNLRLSVARQGIDIVRSWVNYELL